MISTYPRYWDALWLPKLLSTHRVCPAALCATESVVALKTRENVLIKVFPARENALHSAM